MDTARGGPIGHDEGGLVGHGEEGFCAEICEICWPTGEAEKQRFITSTVEQRSKGGKKKTKKRRNGRMAYDNLGESALD